MAGFKYKKFSFTGGDANFPTGTSTSDIRTKEESIVSGFATNLIACNCGWQLDSNRHNSVTDFFDVPKMFSSTAAPGLFLINTTSGCKLFITYVDNGGSSYTNRGMAFYDEDGTTKIMPKNEWVVCRYDSYNPGSKLSLQGFVMSMIPEGSLNNFGTVVNASFLPLEATRLWGSAARLDATTSGYGPYLGTRISNGVVNTFCVWATPHCVGYGVKSTGDGGDCAFDYAIGKIIGDITNTVADTSIQSKYGVVTLKSPYSTVCSEMYGNSSSFTLVYKVRRVNNISDYGNYYIWGETFDSPINSMSVEAPNGSNALWGFSVCKADGTWASRTSTSYVAPYVDANMALSDTHFDSTSNSRQWCPFAMLLVSSDPQTECIYNGSGMKGYLDTSLFRCSKQFPRGTVLDNGNFICLNEAFLTIGWDPTNESL